MNKYPWLDQHLRTKVGAEKDYKAEWGWHRYLVGGKMFAAICLPGPEHHAYAGHPLLTLKCDPLHAQALRTEYPDIRPGFYMDKTNWISIFLDGSVPEALLRDLCAQSYQLVFSKLTKKMQREIKGE